MNEVAVIGTVFVDCKGFAQKAYHPAGRNVGRVEFKHGGVGRNVAENLARLGLPVRWVSTVDASGLGEEVAERLRGLGMDLRYLKKVPAQGMGMWLAVMDERGNLAGSISQMPDLAEMERLLFEQGEAIVRDAAHVILELDLNAGMSRRVIELTQLYGKPVYGIPGNLEVVLEAPELLDALACFICNDVEASKLLGTDLAALSMDQKKAVLQRYVDGTGLHSMVVTLGAEGSIYFEKGMASAEHQPVFAVELVDASGAGDAFFSGTVYELVRGRTLREAVVTGTRVAGWTIEVDENNRSDLAELMKLEAGANLGG